MYPELHHIGIVVRCTDTYAKNMIHSGFVKRVYDPVQQARLSLYENFNSHYLELIEPVDKTSFTHNFLSKWGGGFHHLCYRMQSQEAVLALAKEKKLIKVTGPVPALLFGEADVYFFYSRNKSLVEFMIARESTPFTPPPENVF